MSVPTKVVEAVCLAALDIEDSAQRHDFLERACGDDAEFRVAVESMLSAHDGAEAFFASSRAALVATQMDLEAAAVQQVQDRGGEFRKPNPILGSKVGRYKLLQELGEGGCGTVYLAQQEEPVRRLVAVKIVKPGMDTRSVIARFEAERQALAMMDHPNIARVLDAGATENGRPYFVMELVRGTRVTDFCDQNHLETRQRLHLFIQVCHAIQHAHQKGVIHRDIKPSNILVTLHDGVPVPKVIDFGIAKAIEGRLTDNTLFTAYEQFVGTPAYMSPEQAEMSGLDVDTRSDIYSLGVLLYELLTGRTPFDSKTLLRAGFDEMRRTLREKEPPAPSTMITSLRRTELSLTANRRHLEPLKLALALAGDLDWIVLKALEKDRTRRYETANGLAMDIQRYVEGEPVLARPPSRLYRLQKLVRRNKLTFGAATAVAVALVVGLGVSTWMFMGEKDARQQQVLLREKAEAAEKRANEMREQSEAREKIVQAAVCVMQEKFEEAARLLDEVNTPPPKPSLDGVAAYRMVGEWLALQNRWRDAADRFVALMEIDKLDKWGAVTLDYQACGVVLVESAELKRYEAFRATTVEAFIATTNGDAAGRILKTCLLLPPSPLLLDRMEPLGRAAEEHFERAGPGSAPGWAAIPVSLWHYRCGRFDQAAAACGRGLGTQTSESAQDATLRLLLAMSCWQRGLSDEARAEFAIASAVVDSRFRSSLARGDASLGFWYDWVFARILRHQAASLLDQRPDGGGASPP